MKGIDERFLVIEELFSKIQKELDQLREKVDSVRDSLMDSTERMEVLVKPKIEVDSWWKNNTSVDKVRVTCNDRDMIHTINDVENRVSYSPTLFRKLFTPCEAPALKIEVGSWWLGNASEEKAKVTEVNKGVVHYTYEDGTESYGESSEFPNYFTPCEAPEPEIEVGSWWLGNLSELKAKVTKINSERVHFTYEGGCQSALQPSDFPNYFTPCEAPKKKKETWYLCTEWDDDSFTRGGDYKMVTRDPLILVNNNGKNHCITGSLDLRFTAPKKR
jgi:hypothetical protein